MPSFTYNPYNSTPPSLENVLRTLTQTRGAPSPSSLRSFQEVLKQPGTEWTLDMAISYSSYIFRLFETDLLGDTTNDIPEGALAALYLLTVVMEGWQDDIIYAILVHEDGDASHSCKNMVTLLSSLARKQTRVSRIAMIGISVAYQSLDRIQTLASLDSKSTDSPWWLTESDAIELLSSVLLTVLDGSVTTQTMDETLSSPGHGQVKLAALSVLLSLFKHNMASSLFETSEQRMAQLCRELLVETQLLIDPDVTPQNKYRVPCALTSASLLCLIRSKSCFDVAEYNHLLQTSDLVEIVVQYTFPSCEESSYRCAWATYDRSDGARQHALEAIRCWHVAQNDEWTVFEKLENKWRHFVDDFWAGVLQNCGNNPEKNIQRLLFLHTTCRLQSNAIMLSSIRRLARSSNDLERPGLTILTALFRMTADPSFFVRISSARLLWVFLSGRRRLCTHDELSRAFWRALDNDMIETCVNRTLDHATTEDLQQPFLLALLDILDCQLQLQSNVDLVLTKLGAESVEGIIHLIDPKSVRVDYIESFYDETQYHSQTPPANNLSRLDEKSLCFEQEEVKNPRGLDTTVRLAAATFLAKLGYSATVSRDKGINLLSSRISTAVNDFLIDYQQIDDSLETFCNSTDLNKRLFRLKLAMSTADNEDFVMTMEHTNKKLQQQRFCRLMQDNERIQAQLGTSLLKEKQLEREKLNLKERYHTLSIVSKREMSRREKHATEEARRLISIHASERSSAEIQVAEALQRAKRQEDELREATIRADTCRQRAMELDEKLREAATQASEMERRNNELSHQANIKEENLKELQAELQTSVEALESAKKKNKDLENQIHSQNNTISVAENSNDQLRGNLEELFADMSSLAQIYSFKEKEEASNKEAFAKRIDEIQKQLDAERRTSEEAATKLERVKAENQKLYRKLEKYKLKIEEDRRERAEETQRRKRNGPVSYLNQLQNSSHASDKSIRDRSIRAESSSARRRNESSRFEQAKTARKASSSQSLRRDEPARSEKENSSYYYASAASQARKRS